MTLRRQAVVILLVAVAPAIAHAGPTLYDMQHSSVLRQRLPEHLRNPEAAAAEKYTDRKQPESKAKAGASDAGVKTSADGKAGKQ